MFERKELSKLMDDANAVFPESFAKLPELTKHRLLAAFKNESAPLRGGLDDLTYFTGFVKRRNEVSDETIELMALEWARASVSASPQTDTQGSGDEVILNPTLEIPPSFNKQSKSLRAVYRLNSLTYEQDIDWQEAAVIDELREDGRLETRKLISEMNSKKFLLHKTFSFEEVVSKMIACGILLERGSSN